MPRYIAKFVNGYHTVFDRHTFRNVSLHGLAKVAIEQAKRRNQGARA